MGLFMLNTRGEVLRTDEQVIQIFETRLKLYEYPPAQNPTWSKGDALAVALGATAKFDGTYGIWAWHSSSTDADNGVTVIRPDAWLEDPIAHTYLPGRWILLFCECGGSEGQT